MTAGLTYPTQTKSQQLREVWNVRPNRTSAFTETPGEVTCVKECTPHPGLSAKVL